MQEKKKEDKFLKILLIPDLNLKNIYTHQNIYIKKSKIKILKKPNAFNSFGISNALAKLQINLTSKIVSLNSAHTTIPSNTGIDRPFLNSNPTIAGAKSISSFLAMGTTLGTLKCTVPGGRHFSDHTSTWPHSF